MWCSPGGRARSAKNTENRDCPYFSEARLFVVELFLEMVQHLVADRAFLPEADELIALGAHRREAHARSLRIDAVGELRERRGGGDALAELGADATDNVGQRAGLAGGAVDRGEPRLAQGAARKPVLVARAVVGA